MNVVMERLKNLIKNIHSIVLYFILLMFAAGCGGGGGIQATPAEKKASDSISIIRENYTPPACYYSTFNVEIFGSNSEKVELVGSVRADDEKKRMSLIFTEPALGVTLSRATLLNEMVYLNNPHSEGPQYAEIPLKNFELRGLGNNNISLPFVVFENLLFSRLPDSIFEKKYITRDDGISGIEVNFPEGGFDCQYRFQDFRLREIIYQNQQKRNRIMINLDGKYKNTIFPRTITVSAKMGRSGERMRITFQSLDLKANCHESYFSRR